MCLYFQYEFGTDLEEGLYKKMVENLEKDTHTNCGKISNVFTKQLSKQISKHMKMKRNPFDENK